MIINYIFFIIFLFIHTVMGMLQYTADSEDLFYKNFEARKISNPISIAQEKRRSGGGSYTPDELKRISSDCYSALIVLYLRQRMIQYLRISDQKVTGVLNTNYIINLFENKLHTFLFDTEFERRNFKDILKGYATIIDNQLNPLTQNQTFHQLVNYKITNKRVYLNDPDDYQFLNRYLDFLREFVEIKFPVIEKPDQLIDEKIKKLLHKIAVFQNSLPDKKKPALIPFIKKLEEEDSVDYSEIPLENTTT